MVKVEVAVMATAVPVLLKGTLPLNAAAPLAEQLVALDEFQLTCTDWPADTAVGVALSVTVGRVGLMLSE